MTLRIWAILAAAYLAVNVVVSAVYVLDKRRAVKGGRRISESTLLALAAAGPFGATAGMLSVRHKTRKTRFKLVYVMAVLHLAAIVLLLAAWAGIL
ncbi:MAG: DUF1294 domain-containing protein [Thermoplasmatales archaeon]|nr:DUF1294 domain-containing protein [Thermoplasmatales archaeon]